MTYVDWSFKLILIGNKNEMVLLNNRFMYIFFYIIPKWYLFLFNLLDITDEQYKPSLIMTFKLVCQVPK